MAVAAGPESAAGHVRGPGGEGASLAARRDNAPVIPPSLTAAQACRSSRAGLQGAAALMWAAPCAAASAGASERRGCRTLLAGLLETRGSC